MSSPTPESAASRFDRDYGQDYANVSHEREDNELNHQKAERVQRLYVNYADGTTPADDNNVNP